MIAQWLSQSDLHAWEQLTRVLLLRDYNTLIVVGGTILLGIAAGTVGPFLLLRKRALLGDALAHATLPGIGLAFIIATLLGAAGKALPVLLAGAIVTGIIGVLAVLALRKLTRLKEDAALGIVLSVFFGFGVAVLGVVQRMEAGSAAGLQTFIHGKPASMILSDVQLIAITTVGVVLVALLLFKEFRLLCFDEDYAKTEGWPALALDLILMALVVAVTVVGLQAVGLILVVALLIIPAAAARFWTDRLWSMVLISACIGAVSGWAGASLSALVPRLAAGATIVLVAAALFVFSMMFGTARGVVRRIVQRATLSRRIARQHLLRAIYELAEQRGADAVPMNFLLRERSWSEAQLRKLVSLAQRDKFVELDHDHARLTDRGRIEAERIVRNHRLWEAYLIHFADVAPSHVDRDADEIEHVLGRPLVEQLEQLVAEHAPGAMPPSPHAIGRT